MKRMRDRHPDLELDTKASLARERIRYYEALTGAHAQIAGGMPRDEALPSVVIGGEGPNKGRLRSKGDIPQALRDIVALPGFDPNTEDYINDTTLHNTFFPNGTFYKFGAVPHSRFGEVEERDVVFSALVVAERKVKQQDADNHV